MNSVTPGERREVAKSLRYLAEMTGEPLENDGQFIEVLKYWIFADFKRYSYDETLTRLADLIDPTCKNKQIETNKMAPIEFKTDNFICSNCGEIFCADKEGINAPIDWSYCPNCGARVVRDEA